MMDLEGFLRHVESSTTPLLHAIAELNLQSVPINNDSPRSLHLEQRAQDATVKPLRLDITPELQALGLDPSVASEQGRRFEDLIEMERAAAAKDLSELAYRIVRGPEISGRNLEAVLDRIVFIAQRQFEERAQRTKATALQIARDQMNSTTRHDHGEHSDGESDSGDIRNDDSDSDSEEAVNIECYYPILEEMFLRGVVRPSRDEKLKLSEHTGIPYYNLGIWFQNRRDRGPHAGKGEWMRKYTESRSMTPASHVSAADGAETDDSVSDHGMSEFDEDEWETDPEDVPDLNLLELGPPAPNLPEFAISSSSRQSYPMPNTSESDSTPSTPFASTSRSISFESSSDSFSHRDPSFVSAGASIYTGSPSPVLEPGALLPSLISHTRVPSLSQIHESSLTFGQLLTPTPSTSFSSSISPPFTFSVPLVQVGVVPQMRSNTPSTAPSTPDEGPSTPPISSFGFDFGPTVPFGNSSRPNIPLPNLRLSPAVNDPSPSQGAPQTPLMTLRSFNFEFSLTPSPAQGKFDDVDLSFGSFDIASHSSATSFFDLFTANTDTLLCSDSPSDCASPNPQQSNPPSGTASPPPPQSILLDFAGVNGNNWRPGPTPEPSEVGSQEDAVESKLIAAAALVASRDSDQQAHNPSPFKLAPHYPVSRPGSPLMEPLFALLSPLRDASLPPSPTSPVMGMLPFLTHALRPPTRVDELATYANLQIEKLPLAVPPAAERENLDEPSPLALTRHLELEPELAPQLSLFDVLKEPPVPVVDKATRNRVNDFLKRYCASRNELSDGTQSKLHSFPLTPRLPTTSTFTTVPPNIEAI